MHLLGQRSVSYVPLSGTVPFAKSDRQTHLLQVIFEISPLQALLLIVCVCVQICFDCVLFLCFVMDGVLEKQHTKGTFYYYALCQICFDCVLFLCFVMDCVLQSGETAH